MAMLIREAFREISASVWDNIAHKKRQERKPDEEALTDRVMDRLFDIPNDKLKTVIFSKPEEGKNGADWEWVFLGKDGSNFTVRVQAKVINPFVMQYDELHYKQRKSLRYQSDLLIERAKAFNALPIYCLYTHADELETNKMWRCACTKSIKVYGCSLITAQTVQALRGSQKQKSFADLQPYLLPMHCAVSCNGEPTLSLPEKVSHYWQSVTAHQRNSIASHSQGLTETDNVKLCLSTDESVDLYTDVMPEIQIQPKRHVQAILEGEEDSIDFEELGLRAVTVFFE
ncbi:hypothetical protein OAY_10235 [Vibrio cyclitrophicus ZF205]|uniref:DUF6615 family protein n=1 Tax=Vibrio cyclitrophicus TaxID=47951 RepID=UPI000319123B|nr:DUF6615 family protein [Vibrio cyclitrophicus]OEE18297.1 hypothetical protein OAY_10235 [Vibrio cyclitrophicus ZF205]